MQIDFKAGTKIFVSQAGMSYNFKWIQGFLRSLERRGARTFLLGPTPESPTVEAEEWLRDSDIVVSLLDKKTFGLPKTFFEMGVALSQGRIYLAVVPPDNKYELSLPPSVPQSLFPYIIPRFSPSLTAEIIVHVQQRPLIEQQEAAEMERISKLDSTTSDLEMLKKKSLLLEWRLSRRTLGPKDVNSRIGGIQEGEREATSQGAPRNHNSAK